MDGGGGGAGYYGGAGGCSDGGGGSGGSGYVNTDHVIRDFDRWYPVISE